jgi:hypothetical protein
MTGLEGGVDIRIQRKSLASIQSTPKYGHFLFYESTRAISVVHPTNTLRRYRSIVIATSLSFLKGCFACDDSQIDPAPLWSVDGQTSYCELIE